MLPNRLYRHFGRILVSRANPQKVEMRYYYAEIDPAMSVRPKDDDWKECSEIHYNELMTRKDAVTKYEQTGAPCKEGARVFFDGDITCTGTVRKISKDGSRALVCFDNGDVSWKEYFMIDFIED